jgi:hypothetical protein
VSTRRETPQKQEDGNRGAEPAGGLLFSELAATLHADHVAVVHLLDRLVSAGELDDRGLLWDELVTELSAHSEAEEETVYRDLRREPALEARVDDAIDDHAEIERLLQEIDDLDPAHPPFAARLARLKASVQRHIRDEEEKLLPLAEEAIDLPDLDRLVEGFNSRKRVVLDRVRIERARG